MHKNITRRAFCSMLLALPFPAHAQQPGKIFRIGFLDGGTAAGSAVLVKVFLQELSMLGWTEGKNIIIEYRFGENKGREGVSELAADLVRLKVDLIVVSWTGSALPAKSATTTIPIVMTNAGDAVGSGLVDSLARPGGNITGFSTFAPELITKRLEILKDAIPKLSRVGLLRGADIGQNQVKGLRAAAVYLKLKLEEIETQPDAKGLEMAFQIAKQKQVGAIMTTAGIRFFVERKRIVELAVKYRLPAIYQQKAFVDDGGLMSYGADYEDLFRKAAHYVDRILKGTRPADLPVQQAMKFEFVISLPAAKRIGYTVPYELLARANKVFK